MPSSFSVNNITLMALTLSVGFVVDDAIVMLENIVRHMEGGEKPMDAALRGSKEIGFTILSMTFLLSRSLSLYSLWEECSEGCSTSLL